MQYFVTGATGFIGKRLVQKLLLRKGAVVHVLIRPGSESKFKDLREFCGVSAARLLPVPGDLTRKKLGVSADQIKQLKGVASRCYHLVDPVGYRVGDVLDIFSEAAHAPKMNVFLNAALLGLFRAASPKA